MRPAPILTTALLLTFATTASAQCDGTWLPTPTSTAPGTDGVVHTVSTWDPDRTGPLKEWLVVGGSFSTAGATPANNVAAFDGETWRSLGSGTNGEIRTLTVWGGNLVVGGNFSQVNNGTTVAPYIARWTGSSWFAFGVPGTNPGAPLFALCVWNGSLYAGGIGLIKRWTGQGWSSLGSVEGENACVYDIIEFDGDLYAAGVFTHIGGSQSTPAIEAHNIARWDGTTWHALGTGLSGGFPAPAVNQMAVFQDQLFVGGYFGDAGSVLGTSFIARWSGGTWQSVGEGTSGVVNTLQTFEDSLIVGGQFTHAGGVPSDFTAVWNGDTWIAFNTLFGPGFNSGPREFTVWRGELAVGGGFTTVDGMNAHRVARWSPTGIPTIAQHPEPLTINPNDPATFTTTPTYGYASISTLSYQWLRNNQRLEDDARITGAATPTLTISPTHPTDAGDYTCEITNTCGSITTNPATLTINTPPPTCPGDANNDNTTNGADLSVLLSNFGNTVPPGTAADFNNDALINGSDLSVLLSNFGCGN